MRLTPALFFETKSYMTNYGALFGTVIFPFTMLAFLILAFDPNDGTSSGFRFATLIGLTMLTMLSTAIFGLASSIATSRAHNSLSFYLTSPLTYLDLSLALVLSRLIVIITFAVCFISIGTVVLGITHMITPLSALIGLLSLAFSSIYFFGLALLIARFSRNADTISTLANFINLYITMSSGVFIPLEALPKWSSIFITTSPFYHLRNLLLAAFSGTNIPYVIFTTGILCGLGVLFIWMAADRRVFIAIGRSR